MSLFFTILGILILLYLINYVMYRFFKFAGIVRFLVIAGLILLFLGIYSIPYLAISWSTILVVLCFLLLLSFLIFVLSKFITPGFVKALIVLSVVLLLLSIFLVTFNTIKTDKENKQLAIKETTNDNIFNPNEQLGFNPGKSINELDSLTANANKSYTFAVNKNITPNDLVAINRRKRVGSWKDFKIYDFI